MVPGAVTDMLSSLARRDSGVFGILIAEGEKRGVEVQKGGCKPQATRAEMPVFWNLILYNSSTVRLSCLEMAVRGL